MCFCVNMCTFNNSYPFGSSMVARMLRCGKYQGLLFAEVAALDKPYCGWAMSLPASANTFQKFSTYLRINHGGVLCVGKHKWKYFNEVLQDDPEYTEWVLSLGDPASSLGEFAEFARHGHKRTTMRRNRSIPIQTSCVKCVF